VKGFSLRRHALGKVAGAVHIVSASKGEVVREELHRDDVDDRLKAVGGRGYSDDFFGVFGNFRVLFREDDDRTALPRSDLLHRGPRSIDQPIASGDDDHGNIFVDEGKRPVLQFARVDPFGVDVRQLLDLQGSLEACRVLVTYQAQEQIWRL